MDIRADQPLAPQQPSAPASRPEGRTHAGPAQSGAPVHPAGADARVRRLQFQSIDQIRTGMRDYYHHVRSAQQRHEALGQGRAIAARMGQAIGEADRLTAEANASAIPEQRVVLAAEAQRQTQLAAALRQSEPFQRALSLADETAPAARPELAELDGLAQAFSSAAETAGAAAEQAQSVDTDVQPLREAPEAGRAIEDVTAQLSRQPAEAARLQMNIAAPAAIHLLRQETWG